MNFNIGKIIEISSDEGIILSNNKKYFFLKENLLNDIKLNDYVIFRKENNKAYFIKLLDEDTFVKLMQNKSILEQTYE